MASVAEELERLVALRDRGAISEEEFAQLKARVIESGVSIAPASAADLPVTRLRRSRGDRWLGGICGGLARMTGLESWVWRLVFVL
ncbi:MAG TPA: PspC domain-containing protein, partial [Aquabacterium sp.]|nr:PspC domain-containing protein [Aquabacterium sp.]